MRIETIEDLFITELSDMYNAEKQITKALPKMAKESTNPELRMAFEDHLKETENQIIRLDKVFEILGLTIESEKCDALEGMVKEAEELMKNTKDEAVLDAALIAAAQKVEHYEIASYGTLCALGNFLGYDEAVELLHESLEEEKTADEKLTSIAMESVNEQAYESDDDSFDDEDEEAA